MNRITEELSPFMPADICTLEYLLASEPRASDCRIKEFIRWGRRKRHARSKTHNDRVSAERQRKRDERGMPVHGNSLLGRARKALAWQQECAEMERRRQEHLAREQAMIEELKAKHTVPVPESAERMVNQIKNYYGE